MTGQRQFQTAARQAPWMAAITGIDKPWISAIICCPWRASASASCARGSGNHVDVCAGDKVIRFGGDKHHAAHRLIITNLAYQPRT
jgi:hypothetical protein